MGMVDGRGYDGQQKYPICDTCRPCHSNLSILRPVFHRNRPIHYTYNLKICRFLCPRQQQRHNQLFYPLQVLEHCPILRGNSSIFKLYAYSYSCMYSYSGAPDNRLPYYENLHDTDKRPWSQLQCMSNS